MAKSKWTPTASDYRSAIESQNPWQQLGSVPRELAPATQRPLARALWKSLLGDSLRHQIILGPRRVGKTTVMYQTVEQLLANGIDKQRLRWLRLDHPLLLDWKLGDLVRQLAEASQATHEKPIYLFLDEITYAHRWDLWLKTIFDERWPVRIVGTSSATAAVRERGSESGVGRWNEHFLAPYLFSEFLGLRQIPVPFQADSRPSLAQSIAEAIESRQVLPDVMDLRRQYLLTGGFPELLLAARAADMESELLRSQRILRSDAIEKAIYKDIPQAFKIDEPAKLERLLYVVAGQMTDLFSPQKLASEVGVSTPTVERYLGYLERAFLIFTLSNYSASEEAIQRRGKKVYFIDGAVRNAALLRGIAPLRDPAEMGLLVENMVASHLRALAYQEGVRLYHWRDTAGNEVDLIYDHPTKPLAFEITGSRRHHLRGLAALRERFPRFSQGCYLVSDASECWLPDEDQPGRLPIDMLLMLVGRQEQQSLGNRIGLADSSGAEGQQLLF